MNVTLAALACAFAFCQAPGESLFMLRSAGLDVHYGMLIEAPPSGCAFARYAVFDASGLRGRTPPLEPGEAAVVRIGAGFAAGTHLLVVRATGCAKGTPQVKRMVLHKRNADHSWRADALLR